MVSGIFDYGGGGYLIRLTGNIGEVGDFPNILILEYVFNKKKHSQLEAKIEYLKEKNWIDNRTRAVLVEFATYNAQV